MNTFTYESIFESFSVQTIEVKAVQVCNSHEVMCCFYEWLSLLSTLWLSQAHWWDTSSFALASSFFQMSFCLLQMFLHLFSHDHFLSLSKLILGFSPLISRIFCFIFFCCSQLLFFVSYFPPAVNPIFIFVIFFTLGKILHSVCCCLYKKSSVFFCCLSSFLFCVYSFLALRCLFCYV